MEIRDWRSGQEAEIARLQQEIADLKARLPRHSIPPAMWLRLEELEERLEALMNAAPFTVVPDPPAGCDVASHQDTETQGFSLCLGVSV